MKKVSIIIPVYNVEKYLRRCLDSVLAQTYTNFEAILVDDCSPDESYKICEEYARKDGRIKVIRKEKNGGASSARNVAIESATGEYFSFVDSDDYIEPNYLQVLVETIESDSEADFAQCGFYEINGKEDIESLDLNGERPSSVKKAYSGKQAFGCAYGDGCSSTFNFLLWTKLFKRELVGGIRFVEGLRCEDAIFVSQLMMRASKAITSNDRVYYYCRNDESVMGKMQKDKKDLTLSHLYAYRKVAEDSLNFDEYFQTLAAARLANFYATAFKIGVKDKEVKRMLKDDKKRFALHKNKRVPLIKRVILTLWG